jgi:acyl-CoA reductase-like NAD-dependent aldehyde dehydrogenase
MRIFHEESFGPVTSIIKVRDHRQALEIANDTDYGLSAGVITNDMQKAMERLQPRIRHGASQRLHRFGRAARAVWRGQKQRLWS